MRLFKLFFLFFVGVLAYANPIDMSLLEDSHTLSVDTRAITFNLSGERFLDEQTGTYSHNALILCDHNLSGAFEYSAPRQITLYPREALMAGSEYHCRLNETFFSKSSAVTLHTEPFAVDEVLFFPKGSLRIALNDTVSSEALRKALKIYKKERLSSTELAYDISEALDGRHFLIRLKEPVDHTQLVVSIDQNLASLRGAMLQKAYEEHFDTNAVTYNDDPHRRSMTIYDAPRFIALEDGKIGIRFYFESSFYDTSIKKFVQVEGVNDLSISETQYVGSDERRKQKLSQRSYYAIDVIGDFETGKTYKITLKKGLKDSYNYQLRNDYSYNVTIGDRLSALKFESDQPYLSTLGEVGFESTNVGKINIVIEKLLEQNYRYFINLEQGYKSQVYKLGKQVLSKTFELDGEKNRFSRNKISLKPFLGELESGIYRLIIHYDKDKQVEKTVFFSDIGIVSKLSNDQLFVSASKLSSTKALKNAKVSVYSYKNELIASGKTDKSGIWLYKKKALSKQYPKAVVVESNGDKNFLVLNSPLNGVGMPYAPKTYEKYKVMVYFQSDLVRPGEDLSALIVVKDKNYASSTSMPLLISITDPTNREIHKHSYQTNDAGGVSLTLNMSEAYPTGTYNLKVTFADRVIASKQYRVEAFMPQRIKNSITLTKEAYAIGDVIKANLGSEYLFGAPAANLKAEIRLSAVAKTYHNKAYDDYSFSNELLQGENVSNYLDLKRDLYLNAEGNATVVFPIDIKQKAPSILQAQLGLTVFDDGRGVSAYKSVEVYPYSRLVGLHLADASIDTDTPLRLDAVLLDPLTQQRMKGTLDVNVKRFRWHYMYDSSGHYRWAKEYEDIESFTIDADKAYEKNFATSGDYVIEVSDRLGGHSATQSFSVRGWDYNPISPTNDMGKIEVNFEDKPYKKGDTLKVGIKSPLQAGRLLVSVEGERVLWHKVLDIKKGSASVDIPLNFELGDGLYLHTLMVRKTDTPSLLLPFRARSSSFITPNRETHHSIPEIVTADVTRSNRDLNITVKGAKESYLLLSVVDEGILQISGQKPPRPFAFFTRKADEKVSLYDLYDKVMHYMTEGKMLSYGGDTALLSKARKHLAPDTGAKRVKPFVYWSGMVKTDANGTATFTLPVPSYNGKAMIVALALSKDAIGATSKELVVRDDVIIKPTYPRVALVGDRVSIPIRVFNTTQNDVNLSLTAKTSDALSLEGLEHTLLVPANTSKLLDSNMTARAFGKGEVFLSAQTPSERYIHKVEIPVLQPYPLTTHTIKGESAQKEVFEIPQNYMQGSTPPKIDVTVSNNFITQLRSSLNYLIGYPYGCAEQTSSKMLAMLYIEPFVQGDIDEETRHLLDDRKHFLNEGITKLYDMQRSSGEFAYWQNGGYVNPFASVYASDMLLELDAQKFDLSPDMIIGVYRGLRSVAEGYRSYHYGAPSDFERLYAAYLLAMHNRLDASLANTLYDRGVYKGNLLTHYMMAAILKKMQMKQEMVKVLSAIEKIDFDALSLKREYGYGFYSRSRDLAFALYIHVSNFEKNDLSTRLLEAVKKAVMRTYSTQEKAMALRALAAYYKNHPAKAFNTVVTLDGTAHQYDKPFSLQQSVNTPNIVLEPHGNLVSYSIDMSQYLPQELRHLERLGTDKALNIRRTFVNETGDEIALDSLAIGDLIYSKIELQSKEDIENVVISERAPSCFEIINERIYSNQRSDYVKNSANFRPDYQDIRDDRVLTFVSLKGTITAWEYPVGNLFSTRKIPIEKFQPIIFYTPLRVTSAGECMLPAVLSEAMYDNRISDYDVAQYTFEVKKKHERSEQSSSSGLKQKW